MSRYNNDNDNYGRTGGSWYRNKNEANRTRREEDRFHFNTKSYDSRYHPGRHSDAWDDDDNNNNNYRNLNYSNRNEYGNRGNYNNNNSRDDDNRYRSNYRSERSRDKDEDYDNEFGYGGDPYPEYKYTRGMWGPAGYGIAMGNYEGRPHYKQSGREYADSGREYVSRNELENQDNDYDTRNYNRNRDYDNDRNAYNRYNRGRYRDDDDNDKNIFERMGEGIRDTWNDITDDDNDNRRSYRDRNYQNYRQNNNDWNRDNSNYRNRGSERNPYMNHTPSGYGSRQGRYGTEREEWDPRGQNSRENMRERHSYDRRDKFWHW